MSNVTNVVLLALDNINSEPLKNINKYLSEDADHGKLVEVSKHSKGYKRLETNVYILACNHMCDDDFLDVFNQQCWRFPNLVKLLMLREGDTWEAYEAKNKDKFHRQPIAETIARASMQLQEYPGNVKKVIAIMDEEGKIVEHEIDTSNTDKS